MIEEKGLLIESIHKLIKYIRIGPKNQQEIFASFGARDIQKIIRNLEDSKECKVLDYSELRKASLQLMVHLLNGSQWHLIKKFCQYLKIPLISGKVILNPSMLATIDPMNLKQILILLKYPKHNISHQKVDDQLSNLWFINIQDLPMRIQKVPIERISDLDPQYCILGLTIPQDFKKLYYPKAINFHQDTRMNRKNIQYSTQEDINIPQNHYSKTRNSSIKSNATKNKTELISLNLQKRRNRGENTNKPVVSSQRQYYKYQQQNNSAEKSINFSKPQIKKRQYYKPGGYNRTNKTLQNQQFRQSIESNNQTKIQSSNHTYQQPHLMCSKYYNTRGQARNISNNAFESKQKRIPETNTYRTHYTQYNRESNQYKNRRENQQKYQPQTYERAIIQDHTYQNNQIFMKQSSKSPQYSVISSQNSINGQSLLSCTHDIANSQTTSSYLAYSTHYPSLAANKGQYYSININNSPQNRLNNKPISYKTNVIARQFTGRTYNHEYYGKH